MTKSEPQKENSDSEKTNGQASSGKGQPTPKRKQQEAANMKPLVGNRSPEARKAAKAKLAEERRKAREGLARGDEKYLTIRDRGPQRRLARDVVDARFTAGELVLPAMFGVILISSFDSYEVQLASLVLMWTLFAAVAIDGYLIGRKVERTLSAKFGADRVEKGVRWYSAMRAIQMRPMRLPKPQVKRGTKI